MINDQNITNWDYFFVDLAKFIKDLHDASSHVIFLKSDQNWDLWHPQPTYIFFVLSNI